MITACLNARCLYCAAVGRQSDIFMEDGNWQHRDVYSSNRKRAKGKRSKKRNPKKSKKIKNRIGRVNRESGLKIGDRRANFMDLTQTFDDELVLDRDRNPADEVPTGSGKKQSKNRNKNTKKKKVSNETKRKGESGEKEQSASCYNVDIDESRPSRAELRVVNCPETVCIDIQLPTHHLHKPRRGGYQLPERSEGRGRWKKSGRCSEMDRDVEELSKHLDLHLILSCDAADDDDDEDDGNDALNAEARSRSGAARTSTAIHAAWPGHTTLRATISFVPTGPCLATNEIVDDPNTEHSHHRISNINYQSRKNSRSPVPTGDPEQHQETHDAATKPSDHEELLGTDRRPQTWFSPSCTAGSLSDTRRLLHELDVMLDVVAGLQSELRERETREDSTFEQVENVTYPDGENASDVWDVSETERVERNRVNCRCKKSGLKVHRGSSKSVSRPPNVEHSLSDPDLLERVHQLTLRTNEAEERMNRLECDLWMTPRPGNKVENIIISKISNGGARILEQVGPAAGPAAAGPKVVW